MPKVVKAGLIVGGEYGEGALRIDKKSAGYYNLASGSIGFQIGAEEKDIVILFMTDEAIEKFKNSAAGVPILLAFTFFMGLMLSRMLAMVLGFKNGSDLVMTAFGGTAGIFFVMASLSTVIKRDLSGMGKWLFIGALAVLIGGVINVFVGSTALFATIATLAIGVFSAYLLYDLKNIVDGGETNYISATLAVYLDLFNIFQSLLALLGIFGGERE